MKEVLNQLARLARSFGHDEDRFKSEATKVLEGFASETKQRTRNAVYTESEEVPVVDEAAVMRDWTVMAALALEASREPAVRKARSQVFRSVCLKSNVSLKAGEKRLGTPGTFVLPSFTPAGTRTFFVEQFVEWQTEQDLSNAPSGSPATTSFAYVSRDPFTIGQVIERLVPAQGLMADIAQAGRELAGKYGWEPEEAVTFILFGKVPEFGSVHVRVKMDHQFPARSRLTLSVDPHLDADTVARVYLSARRHIGGERAKGHKQETIAKVQHYAATVSCDARTMRMSRLLSSISELHRPAGRLRYPARAVRDILNAGLDLGGTGAAKEEHQRHCELVLDRLRGIECIVREAFSDAELKYDELTRLHLDSLEPNPAWDGALVLVLGEMLKMFTDLEKAGPAGAQGGKAIKTHADRVLAHETLN